MNTVCAPIKKRFPAIARLLESVPTLVEVSVARSGKVTGRLGNVRLSSEYDPQREALTFVSKQGISDADHVALYGVGMGHHLQPLLDAVGPDGRVMAVEANLSILKAALMQVDNQPESARARILTLSPEAVAIAGIESVTSPAPWLTGAKRPVDFSMLCKTTARPGPEVRRALMQWLENQARPPV